MATIGIVFHSMYGSTYKLAQEVAEGVRSAGHTVEMRRVPELMSDEMLEQAGAAEAQAAFADVQVATVDELPTFDGIIFGSATRFGNRTSQMSSFLDQTGPLWADGKLVGTVAGFFTGAATPHGGHESTALTMSTYFMHHGMVYVGSGYADPASGTTPGGGGPYGPSHHFPQGGDKTELDEAEVSIARTYGRRVAEVAAKLAT